jgi:hypothetical protein
MKSILLVGTLLILLASCSKNQRKINKIDGKWNVTSAQIAGAGEIDPDIIYEFEYCKLRKEDFCDFTIHNFDNNDITYGTYTIEEGGTEVVLSVTNAFGTNYRTYNIIRLGNRKLILVNQSAPNGEFERIEMRKVK